MSTGTPTYVIAATVPEGNRIRGFMRQGTDGASYLVEEPGCFRWAGFDMRIGAAAQLVGGDRYEVNGGRKTLQLYQDGALIFRAAADSEFLGWGQEPAEFERHPRLNPIAVIESNTAFVYLYAKSSRAPNRIAIYR